MFGLKNADTNK